MPCGSSGLIAAPDPKRSPLKRLLRAVPVWLVNCGRASATTGNAHLAPTLRANLGAPFKPHNAFPIMSGT